MSSVKEKNTVKKTKSDSKRTLNLVAPSIPDARSLQPDQPKLWQTMLDAFDHVALLLKKDTQEIVACNKAAREQGITLGKTCFQSWAKRETPCTWCRTSEAWDTGQRVRCQVESAGRIWDAHWAPITDDLYLHYIQDITERKQVEEALRESEEKYRTLFETESNAIFIYDPETTNILDANEATSIMYGYDRDELIGMSCLKFSAEVEESVSALDELRKNGEVHISIRHHQKKDGTPLVVDLSGYTITLGGKPVMFAVSRDITDLIQAEEALKRQRESFHTHK